MILISQIFYFGIIREVLNSRASIRVVGHFRELKLGIFCFSSERQTVVSQRSQIVMHRKAVHFAC